MAKVAVLVDLSFFLKCYRRVIGKPGTAKHRPESVAASVWNTAVGHVDKRKDELYRILVYDCRPYDKKAHHPLSKRLIDFNKSDQAIFRNALLDQLKRKRKMALRLGDLQDGKRWQFHKRIVKDLLNGKVQVGDLTESDVYYDIKQKGVDIKISLDLSYEQRADMMLSTLERFVGAMGGTLALIAEFPDREPVRVRTLAELSGPSNGASPRRRVRHS